MKTTHNIIAFLSGVFFILFSVPNILHAQIFSHFVKSGSICAFSMINCKLHNCFEDFIDLDIGSDPSTCVINNNMIIQDGLNYTIAQILT